jgi:oligopeptide/dipeptide ABC transporter ATP-binding protein
MHVEKSLLSVRNLSKHFNSGSMKGNPFRKMTLKAVDDVSFDIASGETLGLVGESGSGKSTVGRAVLRLHEPTNGEVHFDSVDVTRASRSELHALRKRMQIIFQDPYSSLNPRRTVEEIIGEAFSAHRMERGSARRDKIVSLLDRVGLSGDHLSRYPHEFSGGQRQRIGIARALAVGPSFIVADEAVSALDVSVQAQIINLLSDLKEELGISLLFISHDLSVVEFISDRVMVLYLGKVMEVGNARDIYTSAKHPYTAALLSAAPPLPGAASKRDRVVLTGDIPSPMSPPSGCVFRTRCPFAIADCAAIVPPLRNVGDRHSVACIRDGIL